MRWLRGPAALLAGIAIGAVMAHGASGICPVAASGGFANCVSDHDPVVEAVQALSATGTPYRFQLHRPATGTVWGWWQYADTNVHTFTVAISGFVTGQVDNRGAGTVNYGVIVD